MLDRELGECVDLDECEAGDACDPSATCSNTVGGFECTCPAGSELEAEVCVDIDECEAMPCDENAACMNLDPAFMCECNPGFEGDGITCAPACDPVCGMNEVCVPGPAENICACAPGFEVEGEACVAIDFCERTATVEFFEMSDGEIDCVTPSVCLASPGGSRVFMNVLAETYEDVSLDCAVRGAPFEGSPLGTLWSAGTCDENTGTLDAEFVPFNQIWECSFRSLGGEAYCMLSVEEGLRVDFFFGEDRDLGGPTTDSPTYTRSSTATCDDSALCESVVDGAVCSCPGEADVLADGTCDTSGFCTLECGTGACAFGNAGQFCECGDGRHWDGTDCVDTPQCGLTESYVHQPGAGGDCWTDEICIVRAARRTIFNAITSEQSAGCRGSDPAGLSFYRGECDDALTASDFESLSSAFECSIGAEITEEPLCARVDATGEQLDITFSDWAMGGDTPVGGGYAFAYTRDVVDLCAPAATCDEEAGLCECPDGFDGDGITCVFAGACDLECGDNAECIGGDLGPECVCDFGFADLGEGCVDIDVCAPGETVTFAWDNVEDAEPDCITDDVCLQRDDWGPIYNAESGESGSWTATNPDGTRWALGTCSSPQSEFVPMRDLRSIAFQPFVTVVGYDLCLEVIATGELFDLRFLSYGRSGDGNFSYVRTPAGVLCGPNSTCVDRDDASPCGCADGFELNDDGECVDINECELGDPCGSDTCENTDGTFLCVCETTLFEKVNFADTEDCINEDVCIARDERGPIYNSVVEGSDAGGERAVLTPTGTRWGRDTCDAQNFRNTFNSSAFASCNPQGIVGQRGCLELVDSGELYNIEFSNWQSGSDVDPTDPDGEREGGGGFAYARTRMAVGESCGDDID